MNIFLLLHTSTIITTQKEKKKYDTIEGEEGTLGNAIVLQEHKRQ